MNTAPLKRTLSVTGLLVAGAVGGVVAVKLAAPHWLAPSTATAFSLPSPATTLPSDPTAMRVTPVERSSRGKGATTAPSRKLASAGDARHEQLVGQLALLRKQLEHYRLQHRGSSPQFAKYEAWYQMTNPTRVDGSPTPDGQFGPYLKAAPVNPLNNLGALGLARRAPKIGEAMPGDAVGFVYCTANGALFATDADGHTIYDEYRFERDEVARITATGTAEEKREYLAAQLPGLRAQVGLYKVQHADLVPEFARYPGWEQLTRPTNADGAFVVRGLGPYFGMTPVNPLNGFSKVEIAARLTPGYRARGKQVGYVFETTSEQLYPVDAKGAVVRD